MPTTIPANPTQLHRTRLSRRYDANSAGAKHWLVVLIGTLVILGGGATAIALLL